MVWYLFFLVVIGVIVVFAWDYRRKSAQREAASKERFDQMFRAKPAPAAEEARDARMPSTAPPVSPQASLPAAAGAPFRAKDRFLAQPEALIYLLLKTGLPDHEIFAGVPLTSLLDAGGKGHEREQQLRRLLQYRADFVVCDRGMRVVAAVELEQAGDAASGGERSFKEACFRAGGIRVVRIDPAAPPRRDGIRALVCGEPGKP